MMALVWSLLSPTPTGKVVMGGGFHEQRGRPAGGGGPTWGFTADGFKIKSMVKKRIALPLLMLLIRVCSHGSRAGLMPQGSHGSCCLAMMGSARIGRCPSACLSIHPQAVTSEVHPDVVSALCR